MIFLEQKIINVQVYMKFKKDNLIDSDYSKLKNWLVCKGIMNRWTRHIKISGVIYIVRVQAGTCRLNVNRDNQVYTALH